VVSIGGRGRGVEGEEEGVGVRVGGWDGGGGGGGWRGRWRETGEASEFRWN